MAIMVVVRVKGSVDRVPILTMITLPLNCHYVYILRDYLNRFNSYGYDFHFILRRFHPDSDI
jgi:hypothetical protein